MARKKTVYDLEMIGGNLLTADARIIGGAPQNRPYVSITVQDSNGYMHSACIKDRDLERFAVNILKALGSKKLVAKEKGRKPWGSVCNKA